MTALISSGCGIGPRNGRSALCGSPRYLLSFPSVSGIVRQYSQIPLLMAGRRVHPIDGKVGQRIKLRRQELGFSQAALATALGVAPQQVQKYERGENRVSASKLVPLAHTLKVPVSYFFEGVDGAVQRLPDGNDEGIFVTDPQAIELCNLFFGLRDDKARQVVLDLVKWAVGRSGSDRSDEPREE